MWPPPTAMNNGPPLNKLIAVAIDKDRGSQIALKWAVDNLLARGQTVILIHVKVKGSQSANRLNQEASNDGSGMSELEPQLKELFLPFRVFCTRKDIQCYDVVLEDADVVKAIIEYINRTAIEVLILGAAAKGGLLRFKIKDIPGNIVKAAPDFCTVYVISKSSKISSTRSAARLAPVIYPLRHQFMQQANVKSNSVIASLIATQVKTTEELNNMSVLLAQRESEIAVLQAQLQQASPDTSRGPGTTEELQAENAQLKAEISGLTKQVEDLTQQMLSDQRAAMKRLDQLLFKT